MFHKELLLTLQDIAVSLRTLAKRDSEFPLGLEKAMNEEILVSTPDLPAYFEKEAKAKEEQLSKQIQENESKGYFFGEDVADEDLITGGLI